MEIKEKEKAISEFVSKASMEIIDLAKKQALKRGFESKNISKIEAGDYVTERKIFWVKICERKKRKKSSSEIEFFEDVWHFGYYCPLYIKVTF